MPIPLFALFFGASALTTAVGAGYAGKKEYDAHKNNRSAKEITENAQKKFEEAKTLLEKKQEETQQSLDDLTKYKSEVLENQIGHLISVVTKFKSKLTGFDENVNIKGFDNHLGDTDVSLNTADSNNKADNNHSVSGARGFSDVIVKTGGLAITGAVPLGLTSVAAVAGGVLGGFLAGGLLFATGSEHAEEAEKNLIKAKEYAAEVDKACEKIELALTSLETVRTNCDEITSVIRKLVKKFEKNKVDNMDDGVKFKRMLIIGKNLINVINEPLINKDGTAVENLTDKCSEYLELNYSSLPNTNNLLGYSIRNSISDQ